MEEEVSASALRVSHKERFSFTMKSNSHGTGYPWTGATGTRRDFTPPLLTSGFSGKTATRRRPGCALPATTHLVEAFEAPRIPALVRPIR